MTESSTPSTPSQTGPLRGTHAREAAEVVRELATDPTWGLSPAEVTRRREAVGPNELPAPRPRPAILRFLTHFNDVLIYILLVSAALKAAYGDWIDFAVILVVAVANAVIGFVQEGRAAAALEGIRTMLSSTATVVRGGTVDHVETAALVPGDLVRLSAGDRVPADLRLIEVADLRIEESPLTGEADAVTKGTAPVDPEEGLGDRTCLAFSGTIVVAGRGEGIVTATGTATELGRIQQLAAAEEPAPTPLARQLNRFGSLVAIAVVAAAAAMLVIGKLVHQFDIPELISAAIGFAVAAIPEGLPAIVTISLALGVQQMARRHAITRRLQSVETLGSVSVICSDKTGTLTKNEMTATMVRTDASAYRVEGEGYSPRGTILDAAGAPAQTASDRALAELLLAAGVCNDARLRETETGWALIGEPTEGAMRALAEKGAVDDTAYVRRSEIPFDSAHKYMAVLVDGPEGRRMGFVKGAPDRLLAMSTLQLRADGTPEPLDPEAWEQRIDELGARGLRVLAAASFPGADVEALSGPGSLPGLTFLGLVGIIDPPRPEAVQAVATCREAGVGVKMITGDHAGTATAIARQLGILAAEGPVSDRVLTGAEVEGMSQSQLERRAPQVDVYARTSPEHKIRIVKALQSGGRVVAMTGDGVNDAPALTRADVGVAMGIKGTEATKEAADIVLADDNFATIERAVEEGRRIYDNIRKSVLFMLPTNGSQSLLVLFAVLFGFTLPLAPVQILWVNLVTAVTLSLALVFEPAERGLMQRPPRDPRTPLVRGRDFALVGFVSVVVAAATLAVFLLELSLGASTAVAQTAGVTTLVFGQATYLLNCRTLRGTSLSKAGFVGNSMVWKMIALLLVLQILFVSVPFLNGMFHSTPIALSTWGLSLAAGVLVFFAVEAFKLWWGRPERSGGTAPRN